MLPLQKISTSPSTSQPKSASRFSQDGSTVSASRTSAKYVFWLFLAIYCGLILYKPAFGIIDDHGFLNTLLIGHRLPLFMSAADGRFAPLQGQEYNVAAIFSTAPLSFHIVGAVELILSAIFLVKIGRFGLGNRFNSVPYLVTAAILLTPGFIDAWLRLFINERSEFVLFSILFYGFIKVQRNPTSSLIATVLVAATMALFYKETAFVIVGGLGFFHLLFSRDNDRRKRAVDVALVVLSVLWLVLYYFLIYQFRGPHVYGDQAGGTLHLIQKAIVSDFLHDPVIIVAVVLLLFATKVWRKAAGQSEELQRSVLLTSCGFILAYLVLHMSNTYYLLPLYVFVPYLVSSVLTQPRLKVQMKVPVILVLSLLYLSQVSLSFKEFVLWSCSPRNYQSALAVLSSQISESPHRATIFLGGADRGADIELYVSLEKYLAYKGLTADRYDLRSDLPVKDAATYERITTHLSSSNLSYKKEGAVFPIESGDYMLLTPQDSEARNPIFNNSSKYILIYKTRSATYPDISAKTLIHKMITKKGASLGPTAIDPNYYLYQKIP